MLRRLYNLLFAVVGLILLPGYLRRMIRRGHYRAGFGQRFGRYAPALRARLAQGPPRPWIQAVSVGEMLVALKLIAALRARCPDLPLILSTTTTTGFALAQERAGSGVEVVYTPIDAAPFVRRAFAALRPSRVIIVDGGLWPNLLWEARARGLPVALVNARLSPRSEKRWRACSWLARPIMQLLDLVCVPTAADVARWQKLGVGPARIRVTGSVKFDAQPLPAAPASRTLPPPSEKVAPQGEVLGGLQRSLRDLQVSADAPVLLGGSTHPGEERILGEVYLRLRRRFPELFLIVAPRHAERAPEIEAALSALGLKVIRRSVPTPASCSQPNVLLLDTTGELRDWYSIATVVFIGKSLTVGGGQNPVEAIAAGKPVVFGPRMDNFGDLAACLLAVQGAVQVADASELEQACAWLLADPGTAADQAAAAAHILAEHAGAARRTADLLLDAAGVSSCDPA